MTIEAEEYTAPPSSTPLEQQDPLLGDLLSWWCRTRPFEGTPHLLTPNGIRNRRTGSVVGICGFVYPKTPRNAPCPCGSGKKFKKCRP